MLTKDLDPIIIRKDLNPLVTAKDFYLVTDILARGTTVVQFWFDAAEIIRGVILIFSIINILKLSSIISGKKIRVIDLFLFLDYSYSVRYNQVDKYMS